jgi:hypothetical protein
MLTKQALYCLSHTSSPQCSLIYAFLMAKEVEYFFMYLLVICTLSFENCLFNSFTHFLIELFVL